MWLCPNSAFPDIAPPLAHCGDAAFQAGKTQNARNHT